MYKTASTKHLFSCTLVCKCKDVQNDFATHLAAFELPDIRMFMFVFHWKEPGELWLGARCGSHGGEASWVDWGAFEKETTWQTGTVARWLVPVFDGVMNMKPNKTMPERG